jgi:hypothetical protein
LTFVRLLKWSDIVGAVGLGAATKPSADSIFVLELVISDDNKPLLLNNPTFIPYL